MFHMHAFNPHILLRQYIESYLIVSTEQAATGYVENHLLPHVKQSLVLGLDCPNTVYDCIRDEFCALHFISGPNDEVCRIRLYPGMKKLIINFKPGGFFSIFHIPAHYFNNRSLDAEDYFGRELTELCMQLKRSVLSRQIELLDAWFIRFVKSQKKQVCTLDQAIQLIERNKGNISLRELEKATFTTKRTLERHFLEQVGLHPKTFSRLVRFNEVIRFMESNSHVKWVQIAERFGYYDQSHFIHEFKTLSGGLPQDYFSLKTDLEKLLQA